MTGGWLPPGLRTVVRLRVRAAFRDGWNRVRTPSGALTAVAVLIFLVAWLVPTLWAPGIRAASAGWVERVGPFGLLALWIGQVAIRGGGEVLGFVPSEADQLFAAPFTPQQLLRYKVTLLLIAWTLGALMLAPLGLFYGRHPVGGVLALLLLLPFLQLSAMIGTIARNGGSRSWGRRAAWLALVTGLVLAGAFPEEVRRIAGPTFDALRGHPVTAWLFLPFVAGTTLLTGETLGEVLPAAGVLLAVDAALVAVLLVQGRGAWLEVAVEGAEHLGARAQAVRSGGALDAVGGWWRVRLPRLPRLGGVGPVAWRRALEIARRPAALLSGAGVFVLVGVIGAALLLSGAPDRAAVAWAMLAIGLAWATLLLPGVLRLDFRADLDRMDLLLSLPISRGAIVLGQVLPVVLLVTLLTTLLVGGITLWAPAIAGQSVWALLFAPFVSLVVVSVENALFLWFPVRMEAGEAALNSVGRQILTSVAGWVLEGLAFGIAALLGAGAGFLTGSWTVAAVAAIVGLVGCAAVALTVATARLRRFDPSVHVPR